MEKNLKKSITYGILFSLCSSFPTLLEPACSHGPCHIKNDLFYDVLTYVFYTIAAGCFLQYILYLKKHSKIDEGNKN